MMNIDYSIDRTSYIPLYVQVVEALRQHIDVAQPGDQLPGETDLCKDFDVSRTVIRQALSTLEKEGLIIKEKGIGTFVAQPKLRQSWFQKLIGFHQNYEEQGYRTRSQVLQQELVPASSKLAEKLQIEIGDDLTLIKRLRFVDDEPIAIVTAHLPYAMFPKLLHVDLTEQSLYRYLETEYGIEIARGHRTFEAVLADENEAELLNIDEGAALLLLDSISYLADGTPFEHYKAVHRGDRSRFELEVFTM